MNNERQIKPASSRCSLGKNRWFWVTWSTFDDLCNSRIFQSGYTKTSEEAEQAIRDALGTAKHGVYQTYYAQDVHRKHCAKKRAKKICDSTEAHLNEFVYRNDLWWDYDGNEHRGTTEYKIIKKTRKRIYVDSTCLYDDYPSSFILDRQVFERDGEAWSNSRRERYYANPKQENANHAYTPDCYNLLGLSGDCSKKDIATAYRELAKKHHPDLGGDGLEFKKIRQAYEEAGEFHRQQMIEK